MADVSCAVELSTRRVISALRRNISSPARIAWSLALSASSFMRETPSANALAAFRKPPRLVARGHWILLLVGGLRVLHETSIRRKPPRLPFARQLNCSLEVPVRFARAQISISQRRIGNLHRRTSFNFTSGRCSAVGTCPCGAPVRSRSGWGHCSSGDD